MLSALLHRNFLLVLIGDVVLVSLSWIGAYLLRFNFEIPPESAGLMTRLLPLVVIIKMLTFFFFDLYKGMWRYTSITDLFSIMKAAVTSSLILGAIILFIHRFEGFSRSVFIIDAFLTVFLIGGFRLGIRLFFLVSSGDKSSRLTLARFFRLSQKGSETKNLLIIGAGDCGEKIYREIRDNAQLRYNVIGFIDDDLTKRDMKIHGTPILGPTWDLKPIAAKMKADEALIAIPSANAKEMREVIDRCEEAGIRYKTVPGMGELIDGRVSVKAIRDVAYQDLLGREIIRLEEERIEDYLEGGKVLITGAGGSIGSELCRQICRFRPESIMLYERAESPLYEMEVELKADYPQINVIPILADVRDRRQLTNAFEAHKPQVVFHAAAYKHVPMLEVQPWKAIKNNIQGTRNVIDVASEYAVDKFVFVSTDKAVRPTNIMGATKRVAEMIVQSQNACEISDTRFMIVRFGNVVGSAGSVVPLFRKQIERGGPVTVTDPQVTRYFMTIPEACQLILQAGAMGTGGEIFILEMGIPVRIADMARDLIRLSGFEPDVDINIEYIGLRPGEKLYEELITEGEGIIPTDHEKIMTIRGQECDLNMVNGTIDQLKVMAYDQDAEGIKKKLMEIVPEYKPNAVTSNE